MSGRGGVTLIEALVAATIFLLVLFLLNSVINGSSRLVARGQGKALDTSQAELLFRHLEADLHTLSAPPVLETSPLRLTLECHGEKSRIVWSFSPGREGRVERRTEGRSPLVICRGSLAAAVVRRSGRGVLVQVQLRSVLDAVPAMFQETFFTNNLDIDPDWIPVE